MKSVSPDIIRSRIESRLNDLGLSAAKACTLAGIGVDSIRDLKRRGTIPKRPAMMALAGVLKVDVDWLYGIDDHQPAKEYVTVSARVGPMEIPAAAPGSSQRIPICGIAYGSLHEASGIPEKPIGWVETPPGLRDIPGIYAVYVDGDSMAPQHNPGELRFVDPNRPVRPGDSVIIQSRSMQSGPIKLAIKRFVSRNPEGIIADQINSKRPGTITFMRSAVLSVDRVLTTNELFGV